MPLITRVLEGDAQAWHELWSLCEPTVWAITGKWQLVGPLSRREDERGNIVVDVMARLRADRWKRLRLYAESAALRPGSSFKSWLATVTTRAAIDYVRAHPEYEDRRATDASKSRWIPVVASDEMDRRAALSDPLRDATVSEILSWARASLSADQLSALSLWLEGEDHGAIAKRLGLGEGVDADRLVRAGLKRLRDRLATSDTARDLSDSGRPSDTAKKKKS